MARHVYTSVHLTDPDGQQVVFGPKDELPDWAVEQLNDSWGKHRTDLWGEEDEPDAEQVLIRASGRPVEADRAHARAQKQKAEAQAEKDAAEASEKAAREAGAKAAASESRRSGSS